MFDLGLDLAHALDPVAFAIDRLKWTPDAWQASLMQSSAMQVILLCARQTGKSTSSAALALHVALFVAGALVLLVSPSLRQSRELFAKVTGFLGDMTPAEVLEEDNKSSCTLANGSRIVSLPGDPRTIRGFSAPALILIDEAAFCDDELYLALRPMLATGNGRIVVMSTANGARGFFHDIWVNQPSWERITVLASDCPRITEEFLDQEREALGDWRFEQEYGCRFVSGADQLFSYDLVMAAFDKSVKPLFPSGRA